MLLDKYQVKDGSGLVCYRDLVNNLDTVFTDAVNPTDVIQNARTSAVSYRIRAPSCCRNLTNDENSNRLSRMRRRTR